MRIRLTEGQHLENNKTGATVRKSSDAAKQSSTTARQPATALILSRT